MLIVDKRTMEIYYEGIDYDDCLQVMDNYLSDDDNYVICTEDTYQEALDNLC